MDGKVLCPLFLPVQTKKCAKMVIMLMGPEFGETSNPGDDKKRIPSLVWEGTGLVRALKLVQPAQPLLK
jgi:hypothetical protein